MHRSQEEWVRYAKQHHRYIIFFEGSVMDVTEFIHSHPGGKKALINYIYKDVTDTLFKVYNHDRNNTLETLKHYIIGRLSPKENPHRDSYPKQPSKSKPKKRVCFQDRCEDKQNSGKQKRAEQKSKTAYEPSPRSDKRSNSHKAGGPKQTEQKRKKRMEVSIKLLENSEDRVVEDKFKDWGSTRSKKTQENTTVTGIDDDLDEEKPNFRVPVLQIKHMNRFQTQ